MKMVKHEGRDAGRTRRKSGNQLRNGRWHCASIDRRPKCSSSYDESLQSSIIILCPWRFTDFVSLLHIYVRAHWTFSFILEKSPFKYTY